MNSNSGFKIVIMEAPYDCWQDPKAQDLFIKMIGVKLTGYLKEYPYGVLPVDTSDFISTHHFICLDKATGLEPIAAYRTLSLRKCRLYPTPFPPLSLVKIAGTPEHTTALEEVLSSCMDAGMDISYTSSFAIDPVHRGNPELKNILQAMHVLYHQDNGIAQGLVACVLKFKVERLFYGLGYKDLLYRGNALPPLAVPFVFGEKTIYLHRQKFTDEALAFAQRYKILWKNKILIGQRLLYVPEKKAA